MSLLMVNISVILKTVRRSIFSVAECARIAHQMDSVFVIYVPPQPMTTAQRFLTMRAFVSCLHHVLAS